MGKKQLLTTLILFLLSASLYAQSGKISGRVTDTAGEPLPGVNVVVDKTTTGGSTDSDGYYNILNLKPGTYDLIATFIGFATVRVTEVEVNLGLTTEVNITLTEQFIEGEEIIVIAEQPVIKKDVSSSISSINKESLEALPVASVTSVIGLQAGVENGLEIRGSTQDQVAFNLNGMSLKSERNNVAFTGISMTSVENVQVQTGGFNAEYGNVRSGVINVTTKEGNADRYTLDGIVRVTPPQQKNVGQAVNDPDSYWLRPFLDDEVAWTGTKNGAWDKYTQNQYPAFEGWNSVSQRMLSDDPATALTPEAAQQLFLYQHRKKMGIDKPDYEIDLTLGGPIPVVSKKLGDLRFSASYRRTNDEYFIPLSRDNYQTNTWQGKLTSNIAPGMKLSVEGLWGVQRGTGASQVGNPGFFVSTSGIANNMHTASYLDGRIYASDYWAPTRVSTTNFGAQFTHTLSEKTFYEVKVSRMTTDNSTNPGAMRQDSTFSIGGLYFDERPFGFFQTTAEGIGSGMRTAVGLSTSRDSSYVGTYTASFAITSQVNRINLVKAGFEFIQTDFQVNYGSYDYVLPSGRFWSKWDTNPRRLAVYAQDKLELGSLIANIGLRAEVIDPNMRWYKYDADDYPAFFDKGRADDLYLGESYRIKPQIILQPRLGVSFPITESSKLFFNYGHTVQMPTPENLYLTRVEPFSNTIVQIATPDTKIPKTVNYELGYEQSLADQYLIRISGYYKDAINESATVRYFNKNSMDYLISQPLWYHDTRGLELTFRKQAGKIFWGEANFTYDVRASGYFGLLEEHQIKKEERDYLRDKAFRDNAISRPVPRPFARMQLFLQAPKDFGPQIMGVNPLGDWNVSSIVTWKLGRYVTYPTGKPGLLNNLRMMDAWGSSLRVSKEFKVNSNQKFNIYMDIDNLFNRHVMNWDNMGSYDGNDRENYILSLQLPKKKIEEMELQNRMIPGKDKIGMYRKFGVEFVPIEVWPNFNDITDPNERALYYNPTEEKYYQYRSGSYVDADSKFVKKVLDDKAYIDMPNQQFFNLLDPRIVRFGVRFSF